MLKTLGPDGTARVEFTLDAAVGAVTAAVCGEWSDWAEQAHVMERRTDGGFSLTLDLATGRRYRFRYLLDGHRWENDWEADGYVPNAFGEDDSVVDLTAVPTGERGPAPRVRKATTKRVAVATTGGAKKAAAPRVRSAASVARSAEASSVDGVAKAAGTAKATTAKATKATKATKTAGATKATKTAEATGAAEAAEATGAAEATKTAEATRTSRGTKSPE